MEQETFWTLLHNAPHWEFEMFLMFVFDFLIGVCVWPFIANFFIHHKKDDEKIATLEKQVKTLEDSIKAIKDQLPRQIPMPETWKISNAAVAALALGSDENGRKWALK